MREISVETLEIIEKLIKEIEYGKVTIKLNGYASSVDITKEEILRQNPKDLKKAYRKDG